MVSIAKKWILRSLQYFFIVWDFDNFIPLIQTHNSESMALFLRVLSINFKVREWNNLSNLSDNNSDLFRSHYLISFKVIVFFYVQFIQSTKIGVWNLTWMDKKLFFSWKEWILSIFEVRWLWYLSIKFMFWLINRKINMLFWKIKSWWIDTIKDDTSQ